MTEGVINRCNRAGKPKPILYDWYCMLNVDQAVDISNNDGETPLNLAAGKGTIHRSQCVNGQVFVPTASQDNIPRVPVCPSPAQQCICVMYACQVTPRQSNFCSSTEDLSSRARRCVLSACDL